MLCVLLQREFMTKKPFVSMVGSFETGFQTTELRSAFETIQIYRTTFDQPEDTSVAAKAPSTYAGKPSTEIDNAWRILVAPTVLYLQENEIGEYKDKTVKTDKGWVAG
ncbi:hypothetical protein CH63R_12181 [Colletotrichum higginsianum IMI 349063]|uniref:Uncharacterized protein n=1 Tax=Colletotrichum higginsianum (strain IMI 349063) TaxID=759273 RepID=A0A1B7Y0D5_COLHI|nr:hypothetical protein CH63R_12181 [Colletotrichum higginsianum IMI 349063]OBR05478.1 hypothetical protein CH63R_12181 [Colletotrichum higginsianum IMI 349063]